MASKTKFCYMCLNKDASSSISDWNAQRIWSFTCGETDLNFIKDMIKHISLKISVGRDLKQSKHSLGAVLIAATWNTKVATVITMDSIIIKYYYH